MEARKEMTLHDSLYYATPEDIAFFNEATAGLPKRLPDEPYHCGPQCVRAFRYAQSQAIHAILVSGEDWKLENYMNIKPRILEIGFNIGHSAACWLSIGCEVLSVDVRRNERTEQAIHILNDSFDGFKFMLRDDTRFISEKPFDVAFIDGGHNYKDVENDIRCCLTAGIKRFLFDDWYPHHGPGVQQAVFDSGLLPLAVIGSMAYCEEPSLRGFVKQPEIV